MQFTDTEIGRIRYIAEKMNELAQVNLYVHIAQQIGINKLEKAVGLALEDPKINNPGAYMVQICKTYGYRKR